MVAQLDHAEALFSGQEGVLINQLQNMSVILILIVLHNKYKRMGSLISRKE